MANKPKERKGSKIPYVFGGLSFIPLIGVVFGIIAIIYGILVRKKVPILLGVGGILFSIVLYGSLFYFGFKANFGPYHELKKQLTKQLLTQTRGQILIFKENNNKLPEKLEDLGSPSPENNFFTTSDPWMRKFEYTVNKDGSFGLRSYGPDGIPHNEDDIVSLK